MSTHDETAATPYPTRRQLREAAAREAAARETAENAQQLAPATVAVPPAPQVRLEETDTAPVRTDPHDGHSADGEARNAEPEAAASASAGASTRANEGPAKPPVRVAARVGRALSQTLLTVLAIVGLLCLTVGVATRFDVIKPLVVTSGSMEPSIPVGSLVIGRKLPAAQIEIGDVVTAPKATGGLVTHRVVDITTPDDDPTARLLTLRGDANEANDGQIYYVHSVFTPAFGAVPHAGAVLARMSEGPIPYLAGGTVLLVILALTYRPAPSGGSRHRGAQQPTTKKRRRR